MTRAILMIFVIVLMAYLLVSASYERGTRIIDTNSFDATAYDGRPLTILYMQERDDTYLFCLASHPWGEEMGIVTMRKNDCRPDTAGVQPGAFLWRWKPKKGPDWFFGTADVRFNTRRRQRPQTWLRAGARWWREPGLDDSAATDAWVLPGAVSEKEGRR